MFEQVRQIYQGFREKAGSVKQFLRRVKLIMKIRRHFIRQNIQRSDYLNGQIKQFIEDFKFPYKCISFKQLVFRVKVILKIRNKYVGLNQEVIQKQFIQQISLFNHIKRVRSLGFRSIKDVVRRVIFIKRMSKLIHLREMGIKVKLVFKSVVFKVLLLYKMYKIEMKQFVFIPLRLMFKYQINRMLQQFCFDKESISLYKQERAV